ncbi:MAG TPA: preprotein translocase subunit YajC [Planctomycetaceae bacterium]|jgi:preprotein translocase subunit YajC
MEFWSLVQLVAAGEEKPPAQGDNLLMFAPLVLIAVVFYLLLWKPQRKEQAARDAMLTALKKNDKVVTIGGIVGTVANISVDDQKVEVVTLKVDDNTRIKFIRSSIQRVLTSEGEAEKPAESK